MCSFLMQLMPANELHVLLIFRTICFLNFFFVLRSAAYPRMFCCIAEYEIINIQQAKAKHICCSYYVSTRLWGHPQALQIYMIFFLFSNTKFVTLIHNN